MKLKLLLVSAFALLLSACGQKDCEPTDGVVAQSTGETIKWKLVTSWPKKLSWFRYGPRKICRNG